MTVPQLGAWRHGNRVEWRVWSPEHDRLEVVLFDARGEREVTSLPLRSEGRGYFSASLDAPSSRVLYKIRVEHAGPFPDPWSHSQPLGVHGPSEVLPADTFEWHDDAWLGRPLEELVIYELHVGTATPEGTFEALIEKLDAIRDVGVTAIELMPVASFPGTRNWGYDGVTLNAPSAVYGGPEGLKRLIDAAHQRGLAVLLDVVYNHFGPDGNYLGCYSSRYFTKRHKTPWGDGINYDDPEAMPVRELVLRNAELWIRDYHADGLRLDATHSIQDDSKVHLLQEIAARARAAGEGRTVLVIAEDERNEARLVKSVEQGGYGLDAVWADDFHHGMRRAFAGDKDGYFADFTGSPADLASTIRQGWLFTGQMAEHYGSPRGTLPDALELPQFVCCIQNHDQIGNRALGDRLCQSVDVSAFKAMSALLLLAPETPLLFMGQEWNASTPFIYFTDHHAELGKAVTEGRRREFKRFVSFSSEQIPDPQSPETFQRSKLNWAEREEPSHRGVWEWYRTLLELRATHPCLKERKRSEVECGRLGENALYLNRKHAGRVLTLIVVLRGALGIRLNDTPRKWLMTSEDEWFGGSGQVKLLEDRSISGNGPIALLYEN